MLQDLMMVKEKARLNQKKL